MEWTITVPGFNGRAGAAAWGRAFESPATEFVKAEGGGVSFRVTLQQLPGFVEAQGQEFKLAPNPVRGMATYNKVPKGTMEQPLEQRGEQEKEDEVEEEDEVDDEEDEEGQDQDPIGLQRPLGELSLGNNQARPGETEVEMLKRQLREKEQALEQKDQALEQERAMREQEKALREQAESRAEQERKEKEQAKARAEEALARAESERALRLEVQEQLRQLRVFAAMCQFSGSHLASQLVLPGPSSVLPPGAGELLTKLKFPAGLLRDAFAARGVEDESVHQAWWNEIMEVICAQTGLYTHHDHSGSPVLGTTQKPDSVFTLQDQQKATFGNAVVFAELKPDFEGERLAGLNELLTRFRTTWRCQNMRRLLYCIYGNLDTVCIFSLSLETGLRRSHDLPLIQQRGRGYGPGPGMLLVARLLSQPPEDLGYSIPAKVQEMVATLPALQEPTIIAWKEDSLVLYEGSKICFKVSKEISREYEILEQLRAGAPTGIPCLLDELNGPDRAFIALPQYVAIGKGTHDPTYLRYFGEIYEALVHAHAQGIYHRDVSPHNIMKTTSGKAVLLDWGYATADSQENIGIVGTFFYLSLGQLKALAGFEVMDVALLDVAPIHPNRIPTRGVTPTFRADFEALFSTLVYWVSDGKARWRKSLLDTISGTSRTVTPDAKANIHKVFESKATYFLQEGGELDKLAQQPGLTPLQSLRDQLYPKNRKTHRKGETITADDFVEEDEIRTLRF